jgi:hypothetical protein
VGRYLVLHGGYSGSAELLHDTWVWDTVDGGRWLPVPVQGELVCGGRRANVRAAR